MPPADSSLPRLLPKPAIAQERRQPASLPRRRQPVSNACNSCRTRKTKCDGARPQCRQCSRRNWPCVYTAPPGVTPQQLRKERTENFASVVELIRRSNGASAEEIARRIREADNVDTTISSIADASILIQSSAPPVPLTAPAHLARPYTAARAPRPLLASPYENCDFIFEKRFDVASRHLQADENVFVDVPGQDLPLSNWTSVSTDDRHMNHLLNLFFTWDNVVERVMFRPIFEEDVTNMRAGDADADDDPANGTRFCSRFLVNSLLALSCLYSMDPATYKILEDSKSRGRLFSDEAELLLQHCREPSIPLMQGLYALFAYEGNLGSGEKSIAYFFRCMEVYRALDERTRNQPARGTRLTPRQRREREAMSWCMWGLYCYEWRSTQALGMQKLTRPPSVARVWRESDFVLRQANSVGYWWYPYPISLRAQPSMQVAIREADVALSEIVEKILDYLHPASASDSALTKPRDALELYDALMAWKYQLPDELRFENAALPSVFLLHIALEVMYMAILHPFAHTTKDYFGRFNPRERRASHASHIVSAIWTFRAYGQIRYEYYLVHPLSGAAYIMLQESDAPVQMDSLVRACQCLHEMRPTLPLAVDVLSGIRAAFHRLSRAVPPFMARYFNRVRHRQDGLMHHTITGLLPAAVGDNDHDTKRINVQLEQLLKEFEDVDLD